MGQLLAMQPASRPLKMVPPRQPKARARRNAAAKKAPPKKTAPKPTSKPSMFDRFKAAIKPNRPGSAKMAGGGAMKKKGYKKGGVARGTGAATRGKRFGRAG